MRILLGFFFQSNNYLTLPHESNFVEKGKPKKNDRFGIFAEHRTLSPYFQNNCTEISPQQTRLAIELPGILSFIKCLNIIGAFRNV